MGEEEKEIKAKRRKINAERKRLEENFGEIDEKKKKIVDGLIDECAFMRVELQELRERIVKDGVEDEMQQGQYSITREAPYVRVYHTMLQRYTTATEKLTGLLPKNADGAVFDDGFDDFVDGR